MIFLYIKNIGIERQINLHKQKKVILVCRTTVFFKLEVQQFDILRITIFGLLIIALHYYLQRFELGWIKVKNLVVITNPPFSHDLYIERLNVLVKVGIEYLH